MMNREITPKTLCTVYPFNAAHVEDFLRISYNVV